MPKLKPTQKAYYAHFSTAARAGAAAADLVAGLSDKAADRAGAADRLATLAQVADTEYRSVLDALHASFVTPFDRGEIQAISRALAASARHLESAGALVHLLDPPTLPAEFQAITGVLQRAAAATEDAVGKLRKLRGIKHHHAEVRQLAAEAEFQRRLLLVRLTSGEVDPLDAMQVRAIADDLDAAVHALCDVAETVEIVLITES